MAWVCWNADLLDAVPCGMEAEDTSAVRSKPWDRGERDAWKADVTELIAYCLHSRNNRALLGKLSNIHDKCIERFGFGHRITDEIGKALFVQVSMFGP